VELATKRVLEPLFESIFEECSYGYRPQRSQHQCSMHWDVPSSKSV